jgi:hypothetical protein
VMAVLLDRFDESLARRQRVALGRRRLVLSWHPEPGGGWRARLSGPATVVTIERPARSRLAAIERAARALRRMPALRARIGPRPGEDVPPSFF